MSISRCTSGKLPKMAAVCTSTSTAISLLAKLLQLPSDGQLHKTTSPQHCRVRRNIMFVLRPYRRDDCGIHERWPSIPAHSSESCHHRAHRLSLRAAGTDLMDCEDDRLTCVLPNLPESPPGHCKRWQSNPHMRKVPLASLFTPHSRNMCTVGQCVARIRGRAGFLHVDNVLSDVFVLVEALLRVMILPLEEL